MELSYVCNQEPCGHMNRDGGQHILKTQLEDPLPLP